MSHVSGGHLHTQGLDDLLCHLLVSVHTIIRITVKREGKSCVTSLLHHSANKWWIIVKQEGKLCNILNDGSVTQEGRSCVTPLQYFITELTMDHS